MVLNGWKSLEKRMKNVCVLGGKDEELPGGGKQ